MTVRQRWTMVAAILGSGIVFLDGTVVNVALKKIGEDLPASIVGSWKARPTSRAATWRPWRPS